MTIQGLITKQEIMELVKKELLQHGVQFMGDSLEVSYVSDYDSREFAGIQFDIIVPNKPPKALDK